MKITLLIAFLAVAYHVVRHSEIGQLLTAQRLQDYVENVGPGLARLLYVLVYIVGAVLLLPGLLLSFVGAVLFGVWEGTLYTWIGATIGATCAFLLARLLGRDFVDQLLRGKLRALDDRLRERGFLSLLIIRLVPLLPFNGVNFGCGLTSIRLRDYVLATALGIVPGTFVYQYLFAKLGESLLTEGFSWSDLASLEVLAPLAVFAVFVLVTGWLAHRLGAREQASEKPPSEP
jgi:uncharacterized membrane protein YdjX (TVP38/TMEM64 family)